MSKIKSSYWQPGPEAKTFNVVEMDVSEVWAKHRPCDETFFENDEDEAQCKAEHRNYTELAGGELKAWFICDPDDLGKPDKRTNTGEARICLYFVGHVTSTLLWVEPVGKPSLLGRALREEGCSGYGYYGWGEDSDVVKSLRIVHTVEAESPSEAVSVVREETSWDPKDNPNGVEFS